MRHLKKYFQLNEELNRKHRVILHLPFLLIGALAKKVGIYGVLNYRWNEIKKKTKNSKFDPLIATSGASVSKMKHDLTKINKSELPSNKIWASMFLRKWNLYLSDHKLKDYNGPISSQPVVYLSKDEIKKGDYYIGERLSDHHIYTKEVLDNFKTKKISYPAIMLIAKVDRANEMDDMEKYVEDICLDLKDSFPVEVGCNFSKIGDSFSVNIFTKYGDEIIFSEDLDSKVNEICRSIGSYIKSENYNNLIGNVYYKVKEPLYYYGKKGRFEEIRKYAKQCDDIESKRSYSSNKILDEGYLNVSQIFFKDTFDKNGKKYTLSLNGDDMRVLLDDIQHCSKQKVLSDTYVPKNIQIEYVSIYFRSKEF